MTLHAEPWKRIALTQDELALLYREWAVYFTLKRKQDIATGYYDLSLGIKNGDPKALYNRSCCKRNIAENNGALCDALAAADIDPLSLSNNLEVCDALYHLNRFEEAKLNIFNRSLKFHGVRLDGFQNRSDVIGEDFNATLGYTLRDHFIENEHYFYKAHEEHLAKNIEKKAHWKILKEQGICDVLSVREDEEEIISAREVARRNLALLQFLQVYLPRSWIDLRFMMYLKNDPNLNLPQCAWSSPLLKNITHKRYATALSFLKLTKYVEEIMGDYVVTKTRRIMPWKLAFIHEVYNILALAHIESYLDTIKQLDDNCSHTKALKLMLKMPSEPKEQPKFKFGDRSTFVEVNSANGPMTKHRDFVARMNKRLLFSTVPIERAYLYHEIAQSYFRIASYEVCCNVARQSLQECQKGKSHVWTMLGLLLICKTYAILYKVDKVYETLEDIRAVAKILKDDKVENYVDLLSSINVEETSKSKNKKNSNYSRTSSIFSIKHSDEEKNLS